jgi:1,4-dihydroxy-2-naphthoate octaprenyltransferase
MYALGVIVAIADGASPTLLPLIWGQMGVTAIQLMTHFVNEYYDVERDALVATRTLFSAGSGVLPAGRLSPRVAIVGATICGLLGITVTFTVGLPRFTAPRMGVMSVYAISLVTGYAYSAPPLRLMTRRWGELAAACAVVVLTPLAGYGVAAGRLSGHLVWLSLPLLAMSLAFMITVELPDYEADRATGKHNSVVRLGRIRAGHLHNGLLILSYVLLAFLPATRRVPIQVSALLWWSLPLAV